MISQEWETLNWNFTYNLKDAPLIKQINLDPQEDSNI